MAANLRMTAALMGLTLDIGFACLALGIEGVEVLFEAVLGRLPGIDRATEDRLFGEGSS